MHMLTKNTLNKLGYQSNQQTRYSAKSRLDEDLAVELVFCHIFQNIDLLLGIKNILGKHDRLGKQDPLGKKDPQEKQDLLGKQDSLGKLDPLGKLEAKLFRNKKLSKGVETLVVYVMGRSPKSTLQQQNWLEETII